MNDDHLLVFLDDWPWRDDGLVGDLPELKKIA
jgi:hypothetical protein